MRLISVCRRFSTSGESLVSCPSHSSLWATREAQHQALTLTHSQHSSKLFALNTQAHKHLTHNMYNITVIYRYSGQHIQTSGGTYNNA